MFSVRSLAPGDHHVSGQYQPCGAQEYPTPACPTACDSNSTYTTPFGQDAHIFNSSYSVSSDPTQIQMEIMTNGPVEAAFTVYADFESYKGGGQETSAAHCSRLRCNTDGTQRSLFIFR